MAGKGAGSGVSGTLMGVAGQAEPRAPGGPLPPGEAHRRGHEALSRGDLETGIGFLRIAVEGAPRNGAWRCELT